MPKYYAVTNERTRKVMIARRTGRKWELMTRDGSFVPVACLPDEDDSYATEVTYYVPAGRG